MFKGLFVLEFSKYNFLFLKNLQKTVVNSINIFELKNCFITLFQFKTSCSIRSYYFFKFRRPLHTIALQKKNNFDEFSSNFHISQAWR
jgi:hypothetical protein